MHCILITNCSQLPFREKNVVYSGIRQNSEIKYVGKTHRFLMLKHVVYILTAMLQRVNSRQVALHCQFLALSSTAKVQYKLKKGRK
jgi:hypothetical protein